MTTPACPHCHTDTLAWFRSLPDWIAAVTALGVAYDSQLAYEMMTADPSLYWLCHDCGQGGMAASEDSSFGQFGAGEAGPATMVTTAVTVGVNRHLVAAHTRAYAREHCPEYRRGAAMIAPDVVAMREASGQDKDGGDDEVFRALAEEATDNWRETARKTLSKATIGELPEALRVAGCFPHAFSDVLWDELGESSDDACGAGDQARLDNLVGMWMELRGSKASKPVSRKARQKAEAKLRAASNRRGK